MNTSPGILDLQPGGYEYQPWYPGLLPYSYEYQPWYPGLLTYSYEYQPWYPGLHPSGIMNTSPESHLVVMNIPPTDFSVGHETNKKKPITGGGVGRKQQNNRAIWPTVFIVVTKLGPRQITGQY